MKTTERTGLSTQNGAALLAAMLTVTLVATLAASALWQQWRAVEIEAADRSRVQAGWILSGATDWLRLILIEDSRPGSPVNDNLSEPWSIPLKEARLSSFLAADANNAVTDSDTAMDAFLSGEITDAQGKLNVRNLIDQNNNLSVNGIAAFTKLFDFLKLPTQQVASLANNLQQAAAAAAPPTPKEGASAPATPAPSAGIENTGSLSLMPQRLEQLVWLGLPPATLDVIRPYVALLPQSNTSINLNTASAEVIYAAVPVLSMASAQKLVDFRTRSVFGSIADAVRVAAELAQPSNEGEPGRLALSVVTSYFDVKGRLRIDNVTYEETSMLQRSGMQVKVLWRARGVPSQQRPTQVAALR